MPSGTLSQQFISPGTFANNSSTTLAENTSFRPEYVRKAFYMQVWREAPEDHHHCASLAHLPVQYLGQPYCMLQARDTQHEQSHVRKGSQIFPLLPALPSKVLKGSLSRHLKPVWDMMSNICHTRTDKKGEALMLRCVSAQLQVWKGMLTAV